MYEVVKDYLTPKIESYLNTILKTKRVALMQVS